MLSRHLTFVAKLYRGTQARGQLFHSGHLIGFTEQGATGDVFHLPRWTAMAIIIIVLIGKLESGEGGGGERENKFQ